MPRFTRVIAATAACALIGGVATTAVAATPDAPKPSFGIATADQCHGYLLTAGPKLKAKSGFRTEFIGTIKLNGQCGICIDYGLQGPDDQWGTGPISSIKDSTVRGRVAWLANAYSDDAAKSDRQAAALKVAINRLVSADFRSDWPGYAKQLKSKDTGVAPRSDEMLTASLAAGPVKVDGAFTAKPAPGGTGTVEIKALGNGRVLAGQSVTWKIAGGKVVSGAKATNSAGTAVLKFTRSDVGAVDVTATVESPEWRKTIVSTPSSRKRQHLVRGSYSVKSSVRLRFDSLLGATVEQNCDTTCDGKPPVTLTAEAGAVATTWQALIGGKVAKTLTVPAGKKASAIVPGAKDGDRITFRYRIGKGSWRTSKTTFTVVCPPWPTITVVKTCVCKGAGSVTYTIAKPAGIRSYVARFTVGGDVKTVALTGSETFTAPLTSGTTVAIGFSAYDKAGGTQLATGVLDGFTQS